MTPWTPRERALYEALEASHKWWRHDMSCQDGLKPQCKCQSCIDKWVAGLLADPPPPDPRDEALRLAEAELLRLWMLVPVGRAGVGGVRTIELEDDEVARLRQIVDALRAANGGA